MHILFQEVASIPDGPAASLDFRADLRISSALILSKITGWKFLSCSVSMVSGLGSRCAGCLALSSSSTVLWGLGSGMLVLRGW